EKLEVTANSRGQILKSGEYPTNSIFYVPPISLPEGPVNVGDTWTMQASWLSLEEMVPFQIDMVSILKNVWTCGDDRCAEVEVSAQVDVQGPVNQNMAFRSVWQGKMYFALNAGTVVWSRVDSEESLTTANGLSKPACEALPPSKDTVTLAPTAASVAR
uniref:Big_5 domain-containing protein n=1 Tax=Globodera pallida TaxID=36090 RepID=A0A183CTR2_GLOPA